MPDQTNAVVTAPPPPELTTEVIHIAGRGEVERLTAKVTIPPDYQYAIEKWSVDEARGTKPDGKPYFMKEVVRVGLTVDAYDYMNRVLGVSFFFPDTVPNGEGERVPNPIWTPPDFTTVLMGATWTNPMGQQVVAFELVSTDFWRIYQDKRANSGSAHPMVNPDGEDYGPTFDKRGDMNLTLSPGDELKAYQELTRSRALGPRYAQTVGRVRLLKEASGVRSLPIKQVRPYELTLTGFRDQMEARTRVAAASASATEASLYGRPVDERAHASAEEMAAAGANGDDDDRVITDMEQERVRQTDQPEGVKPFTPEELRDAGIS